MDSDLRGTPHYDLCGSVLELVLKQSGDVCAAGDQCQCTYVTVLPYFRHVSTLGG
jgi:hypothetical protein